MKKAGRKNKTKPISLIIGVNLIIAIALYIVSLIISLIIIEYSTTMFWLTIIVVLLLIGTMIFSYVKTRNKVIAPIPEQRKYYKNTFYLSFIFGGLFILTGFILLLTGSQIVDLTAPASFFFGVSFLIYGWYYYLYYDQLRKN